MCDFLHFVVILFKVKNRICNQSFWLLLTANNSWPYTLWQNWVKSLIWLNLSVILYYEVFKIELCNINVFICIFHIFSQAVDKSVKHNRRLFIKLTELLFLLVHIIDSQLCWSAVVQLVNDFYSLLKEWALFLMDLFEYWNTRGRIHKLHAIHLSQKLLDSILLL